MQIHARGMQVVRRLMNGVFVKQLGYCLLTLAARPLTLSLTSFLIAAVTLTRVWSVKALFLKRGHV